MPSNPFRSFWMAGYECTDQQNAFGNRVDFLTLTGHLQQIDTDYQLLKPFQIRTVREGIRWSQVEKQPYQYDWGVVEYLLERGQAQGIQQVWDLCHFGYPDDLTPLHPMFARRFAALCRAFVTFYRDRYPDEILIVTPINEVSFMSWLGGDVRGTVPYCVGQGWEVKYGLMRAYIEGTAAIRELDPTVRFLTTEPLVNIIPRPGATPRQRRDAAGAHQHQFQSVDMLTGRLCPELGGRPEFLDILGVNFYYDNQWVREPHQFIGWNENPPDPRWRPLSDLLREAYRRYRRPVVISETSHPGIDRPHWMRYVARECALAVRLKVPLWGVCLYPIVDRPDWDHLWPWHRSGLWDAEEVPGTEVPGTEVPGTEVPGEVPQRILCEPYAEALREAQRVVTGEQSAGSSRQVAVGR